MVVGRKGGQPASPRRRLATLSTMDGLWLAVVVLAAPDAEAGGRRR